MGVGGKELWALATLEPEMGLQQVRLGPCSYQPNDALDHVVMIMPLGENWVRMVQHLSLGGRACLFRPRDYAAMLVISEALRGEWGLPICGGI